jgi:hypothetical protein
LEKNAIVATDLANVHRNTLRRGKKKKNKVRTCDGGLLSQTKKKNEVGTQAQKKEKDTNFCAEKMQFMIATYCRGASSDAVSTQTRGLIFRGPPAFIERLMSVRFGKRVSVRATPGHPMKAGS